MQLWRVVRIVSLSLIFLSPGAIAAAADEPLPPVTPFIDSAPVPPPKQESGADAGQPPITPFLDSAPIPPDPATQPSWWYGAKIIAADLGTLTCFALSQNGICAIPYFFAGAAIHAVHGRSGRAWISVGVRVYAPVIGGLVGSIIGGCPMSPQEPSRPSRAPQTEDDMSYIGIGNLHFPHFPVPCDGMIVGALVGVAASMVLDAAQAFTPPPAPVAEPRARGAVRLAPRLSFGQANLTLGLSATF
jgi:hypothetical protein